MLTSQEHCLRKNVGRVMKTDCGTARHTEAAGEARADAPLNFSFAVISPLRTDEVCNTDGFHP